jgi:septum formation protein
MLKALGVPFEAVTPVVAELEEGMPPPELVTENARRKARAGLELSTPGPGALVLGVDTEVMLDGAVLGKAATEAEARSRLLALSGRTHEVLSGVVLVSAEGGGERFGVARSLVTFRDLDEGTIERYLGSGEWRDRAGAYAIQGLGSLLVERVEGDFANVVGLPLRLLAQLAPEVFPANPAEGRREGEKP